MAIHGMPDLDANIALQQKLFNSNILKLPEHRKSQKLKIVLKFDGFDENSPRYKAKTTGPWEALQCSNIFKLLITTRMSRNRSFGNTA